MLGNHPDHVRGLVIAAIGGLVLTIDIPVLRLANGEPWSVMFLRSAVVLCAVVLFVLVTRLSGRKVPVLIPGKVGWLVTGLYGISAVTFISAVFHTTTANLVFILAFNPMFAAMLSWIFLGERPRTITLIAMAIMIGGVLIIVQEGLGSGNTLGDVLSLITCFTIAAAITVTRASGKDMGFTALVASIAPFLVAAFMVAKVGYFVAQPWWLVLNGMIIIPISFFCLASAPKLISGAEVAMFYLLETVLAPIWVWMVFSEIPSRQSAIGGTIIIFTLIVHSLWQLNAGRKRKAAMTVRRSV